MHIRRASGVSRLPPPCSSIRERCNARRCVRQRAPADIAGKDGFLFVGRVAVLGFEDFREADRRDIVAGLFMQAALAYAMGGGDAEVAGRLLLGSYVEGDSSGSKISRIAISQAWWYSIFFTDTRSYRSSLNRSAVSSSACRSRFSRRSSDNILGW
jgi:hypothetical protein